MKNKDKQSEDAAGLRQEAEEIFLEKADPSSEELDALSPEETRQMLHELQVHQIELELQNKELRRSETELDASRTRYFDLYDLAPVGYVTLSEKGLILEANLTAATLLGVARGKLSRQLLSGFIIKEHKDVYYRHHKALLETKSPQTCELQMVKNNGSQFWVHLESTVSHNTTGEPVYRVVLSDITERVSGQRRQYLATEILGILNDSSTLVDALTSVLIAIKQETGFDAVGIRLRSDNDYPYFVQNGFSNDFLLAENTLIRNPGDGGFCMDDNGNYSLECTCGLVLLGHTDPTNPLFSPGGSFWTNNSLSLLDLPAAQDPRVNPRNRCIHEGFSSVALIPIRAYQQIVGLLQLNDRRKDCFTLEIIHYFEGIGASIGIAVMRKQAEDALKKAHAELDLRVQRRTAKLRESEETARARLMEIETYYNTIPVGLCLIDKELRFIRINERLAEMNGMPTAAHLGRTIREMIPLMADQAEEVARRVMASGESFSNIEFTGETTAKPGVQRTWQVSWVPFKDTNGQVINIGVMVEEITEQRRLEEELRQAHKMEAMGTLAGGIAHDFNNILAGIIGFTEMVHEDVAPDSPEYRRLALVLKGAQRGSDLVRQILAFSRKTLHIRQPLSLSALIKETIQLLRASLPTSTEIRLDMKATKDTLIASPAEIQQILMNLATNASFAMKEKGGILNISISNIDLEDGAPGFHQDVKPGEFIQIVVTDTGSGIAPHVMKRIFEPFFTTKGVGEGTGMGLAAVYGTVLSLQGAITVESEPGMGSTFRVFLPVAQTDETPEDSEIHLTPGGTERILFVDDEELLVEWGQTALERLGYTVTSLADSTEALQLFSVDPSRFDLVILDQTMPKLSGLHLARKLLTLRNSIPIILCTGYSDSASAQQAKEAGIKEFLMKPVGKQKLAEAIRRVLNDR